MELSIPYELRAPDGNRVVVGNGPAAVADPDWIGFLDPDQAITGLLDGTDLQGGGLQPLALQDGALTIPAFDGGRSGTMQGILSPNVSTLAREALEQKLKRTMRACRRADGLLTWQPTDGSPARMLRVRDAAGGPDCRGRQPRTFMLTLTSPDSVIRSRDEAKVTIGPVNGATGMGSGVATPHLGDAPAWPRIYFDGPITNPTIFQYEATGYRSQYTQIVQTIANTQRLIYSPENKLAVIGTKLIEPGFENNTSGWSIAGLLVNNAPTSLTRITTQQVGGGASGQVVNPAIAFCGPEAHIPGPFIKGRTYIVRLWVRSSTQTTPVSLIVWGAPNDLAGTTPVNLRTIWTEHAVSWTPARTCPFLRVVPRTTVATATTWQIDNLSVKEVGKEYDYCWQITSPVDVSGAIQPVGGAGLPPDAAVSAARLIQLSDGVNGELVLGCAASGGESYVRMIFNHGFA